MDFSTLLAAFASAFTQEARLLTLRWGPGSGFGAESLLPDRLSGHEQISGNYRLELSCLSPDTTLELKHFQGQIVEIGILAGDGSRRHISGIVTDAQQLGSDGGFANYRLIIEPALSLLAQRVNSRSFQDMTVPDIVAVILNEHRAANPVIQASFQLDTQLKKTYPLRSYCLQYAESDLAFIERLLREEGISYGYTFSADDNSPIHTLQLFDDVYTLPSQAQESLRFHRDSSTEAADSVTEWLGARLTGVGYNTISTYDYKPVTTHIVQAMSRIDAGDAASQARRSLEWYDPQVPYFGADQADVQRYADLRRDARDMQAKTFRGQSNAVLGSNAWFRLDEHPIHDQDVAGEREFVVLELDYQAQNNLPTDLAQGLQSLRSLKSASNVIDFPSALAQQAKENTPPYSNSFKAIRRGIPIVPDYSSEYAKPTAKGSQTATVVGPPEEEIHTDEMGRIKLQFHWQRPQDHPQGTASFDDKSSTWVRIAYGWAGSNWGCQQIPRVGQEVQVTFLNHDIDRPIVTGVNHNGRNMPPTFSGVGSLPANKTLSGIKTKEYKGSAYNELLFDDSTNETRTKLSSEHAKTQLNQGFLIHPRTEGKGEPRGEGFELRTDEAGALRAAQGLLISTEARRAASGKQLDRTELLSQLKAANDLANNLSDNAAHQLANQTETGKGNQLLKDDKVQANSSKTGHQQHVLDAIEKLEQGSNTDKQKSSSNSPSLSQGEGQDGQQPILAMSAPAGIALVTPNSATLSTGTNFDQVAQRDTNQSTGRRWIHNVGESMSLFVAGLAKTISMKLIAAKGKVQMQAQSGEIEVTADQAIKLTAVTQNVTVAAAKDITMTSGGGYIKVGGGDINLHTPGMISIKCAKLIIEGGVSIQQVMPVLPLTEDPKNWIALNLLDPETQQGVPQRPYTIHFNDGPQIDGELNADGLGKHYNVPEQGVKRVIYHPRDPKKDAQHPALKKLLD